MHSPSECVAWSSKLSPMLLKLGTVLSIPLLPAVRFIGNYHARQAPGRSSKGALSCKQHIPRRLERLKHVWSEEDTETGKQLGMQLSCIRRSSKKLELYPVVRIAVDANLLGRTPTKLGSGWVAMYRWGATSYVWRWYSHPRFFGKLHADFCLTNLCVPRTIVMQQVT